MILNKIKTFAFSITGGVIIILFVCLIFSRCEANRLRENNAQKDLIIQVQTNSLSELKAALEEKENFNKFMEAQRVIYSTLEGKLQSESQKEEGCFRDELKNNAVVRDWASTGLPPSLRMPK